MAEYFVYSLENKSHHGGLKTVAEAWWYGKELVEDGIFGGIFLIRAHEAGRTRDINAEEFAIIEDINNRLRSLKKETITGIPKSPTIPSIVRYGLRIKGHAEPLKVYKYPTTDGSYCVEIGTNCNVNEYWTVDTVDEAKIVQQNPLTKPVSYFMRPFHTYKPEDLEVVEITMQFKKV